MHLKHQDFYEEYVFTCNRCKSCTITDDARCLPICPSYDRYGFFTDCAGGKAHIAQKILEGKRSVGPELREAIYRCLLCQACKVGCPVTIDTYLLIRDLRQALMDRGLGPMPEQKSLLASLSTSGHPLGHPQERKGEWLKDLGIKDATREPCEFLLYAGCNASQGLPAAQPLVAAVRLLQKAGLDIGVLGEKEKCCGAFAAELGDHKLFLQLADENISSVKKTGVKKIITTCPYCYAFMKKEYQDDEDLQESLDCEIIHVTEMLARALNQGALTLTRGIHTKVTYHDPCQLGRHANVFDAPRDLMNAIPGIELVEMERSRENSYCCGNGTGVRDAFREFSEITVLERLREAQDTGAEILITACPHCYSQFQEARKCSKVPPSLKVMDLLELVASSAGNSVQIPK